MKTYTKALLYLQGDVISVGSKAIGNANVQISPKGGEGDGKLSIILQEIVTLRLPSSGPYLFFF